MNPLSKHTKQELINALNGKQSGFFVLDGKLVSIEIENKDVNSQNDLPQEDLSIEIEEYTELKESLTRYLNNPSMKRYSANELKVKRHAKRKK